MPLARDMDEVVERAGHAADATAATMAWHVYLHHVELAAGVSDQAIRRRRRVGGDERALLENVRRAYRAGEPVWMIADEVRSLVRDLGGAGDPDVDDRAVNEERLRAWLEALARERPGYRFAGEPGRAYVRVYHVAPRSTTRSAVAFVDLGTGLVYRADSWRKRGRLLFDLHDRFPQVRG